MYEPPGNAACEHDEHERIVDCIERAEAQAAVELMDAHLRTLEHSIVLRRETPRHSLKGFAGAGGRRSTRTALYRARVRHGVVMDAG
ncbi:FCD domain-containing protein [Methylibium sp.]|uniref:FCD domain-containing protein n=1 Tax=Methylibium sp. TaxID=2067992 RepID=UPI00345BC810